MTKHTNNLN